jgi:hypothetical protein
MAQTVTLRATARHPHRKEGQIYEASGRQAMADLYKRWAVGYRAQKIQVKNIDPEESADVSAKPEAQHTPHQRKKRRYNRRDMRAE